MLNLKIHHVSINVTDLTKSKDFYVLLDFAECHNFDSKDGDVKIIHLSRENFILELFCYSVAPISKTISNEIKHNEFIGIDHFSLQTDNIENAYEMLRKYIPNDNGIQTGRTDIRYFFVVDPDGNQIEIVEDKRESSITKNILK